MAKKTKNAAPKIATVDALYHALANRGASILGGPTKTHWGAKFLSVRAGEYTLAFIEKKGRALARSARAHSPQRRGSTKRR